MTWPSSCDDTTSLSMIVCSISEKEQKGLVTLCTSTYSRFPVKFNMTVSKSNSDLFNIPGYHFISNSREHKLGGGVGLYIQSDMNFKPRIDLQSSDNSLYESVFVEIMRLHGKNIIVGCLYIPPDASLNDFNRSVEDILSAISFENKVSYSSRSEARSAEPRGL